MRGSNGNCEDVMCSKHVTSEVRYSLVNKNDILVLEQRKIEENCRLNRLVVALTAKRKLCLRVVYDRTKQ